jgi:hypothetical protein
MDGLWSSERVNHPVRDGDTSWLNKTEPVTPTNEVAVGVEIGDRVYVDPMHAETPRKTAGLAGIVDQLEGDRARVIFGKAEDAYANVVPRSVLRHDRRLSRRPLRPVQGRERRPPR